MNFKILPCPAKQVLILATTVVWLGAASSAVCAAEKKASSPGLGDAKWIWDAADDGKSKHYVCHLRKTFTLDAAPVSAVAVCTADNYIELFVNGQFVGGDVGDPKAHWQTLKRFDIAKLLRKGPNAVVVRGINAGGDGGVVASIEIKLAGEKPRTLKVPTDGTWRMAVDAPDGFSAPDFDDRGWKSPRVIGPVGIGPWGYFDGSRTFDEPPTETLAAEEADAVLCAEWLYQAQGKPLSERAAEQIAQARASAARLAKGPRLPDCSAELAQLGRCEAALQSLAKDEDADKAEAIYLDVRRAKRAILLKNPAIDFSQMVFIDVPERYPHESMHRVYPQAQLDCVRLLVLDGLHPGGKIRKLTEELGPGWYWRPDVSFDGTRVLFCFRPAGERTFHLYEAGVDGSGLRQITSGSYDDQDPIYLPDGRIAFLSNRGNSYARCTVGHPSPVLTRCDADGKNIYILSGGGEPEYTPALMPDGRILYTRWEYTDKELMRIQSLWTVNPDGTGTSVFWGNQSYWPDVLMEARPIPGSRRVLFASHGHHEVYWGGVGMLDVDKGRNYPNGLTKVSQELPWIEVGNGPDERMETPEYHREGVYGGYKSPYPLTEDTFLVSARQGPPTGVFQIRDGASRFKLFLMDVYGNRELIYQGAYHILYGMPIRKRAAPPALPDQTVWAGAQKDAAPIEPGVFYSADIFQGAPAELRDKAKYLRVVNVDFTTFTLGKKLQDMDHPNGHPHMHVGPVMSITCNDGIKRVLGTVPIEKDGSVAFEAPPCKSLHFQLLDESHRALHTMRSFANLMPGERRGCVGCHETHSTAPQNRRGLAMDKPPEKLSPYPWGADASFGYERDIHPILAKYCGSCHEGEAKARQALDLTLRPSADAGAFPEPYVTLTLGKKRSMAGDFPGVCEGGIAGTILAEANPWRPSDYCALKPMTTLSYASRLIDLAASGKHYDVKVDPLSLMKLVVWVDTLCPYRGEREVREMPDPDPNHPFFKRSDYPPSDSTIDDVYRQSPYRPRMRTAPLVHRAYRQDEFPSLESRLPRDAQGNVIPPVQFTPDGRRIETW